MNSKTERKDLIELKRMKKAALALLLLASVASLAACGKGGNGGEASEPPAQSQEQPVQDGQQEQPGGEAAAPEAPEVPEAPSFQNSYGMGSETTPVDTDDINEFYTYKLEDVPVYPPSGDIGLVSAAQKAYEAKKASAPRMPEQNHFGSLLADVDGIQCTIQGIELSGTPDAAGETKPYCTMSLYIVNTSGTSYALSGYNLLVNGIVMGSAQFEKVGVLGTKTGMTTNNRTIQASWYANDMAEAGIQEIETISLVLKREIDVYDESYPGEGHADYVRFDMNPFDDIANHSANAVAAEMLQEKMRGCRPILDTDYGTEYLAGQELYLGKIEGIEDMGYALTFFAKNKSKDAVEFSLSYRNSSNKLVEFASGKFALAAGASGVFTSYIKADDVEIPSNLDYLEVSAVTRTENHAPQAGQGHDYYNYFSIAEFVRGNVEETHVKKPA